MALLPWLGCGSGYVTRTSTLSSTTSTTSTTSTGSSLSGLVSIALPSSQATQVENFGDSITCGLYASPNDGTGNVYSKEGYAGLFDAFVGETAQNLCRSGDQAADMARLWVNPNAVPAAGARQLYTVTIGTNDANACGASAGCLANWQLSLEAALAWLGLPAGDKITAQNAATTGAWTQDFGFGMATGAAGATLSFQVKQAVAGRRLYLAYRVFDASAAPLGTATVSIDGVVLDTLTAQAATGHALHTQNATTDTIFLDTLPLGAVGTHTVTVTNSAAGGFFSVLWAGASTQSYASVAGSPRILLGQVPLTTSAGLNATVATYNAQLATILSAFAADGLYITPVLDYGTLDPNADLSDAVHPNTQGHAKLAAAFEHVL